MDKQIIMSEKVARIIIGELEESYYRGLSPSDDDIAMEYAQELRKIFGLLPEGVSK